VIAGLVVAVHDDDLELVVEPDVDLRAVRLDDLDLVGRSLLAVPLACRERLPRPPRGRAGHGCASSWTGVG
jgi:hypothetical protein